MPNSDGNDEMLWLQNPSRIIVTTLAVDNGEKSQVGIFISQSYYIYHIFTTYLPQNAIIYTVVVVAAAVISSHTSWNGMVQDFELRLLATLAFAPFPNDKTIFSPFKRIQHPRKPYFWHLIIKAAD